MSVDYKITNSMSDTQKMVRLSRWEKHKAEQGIVWADWIREVGCRYYKKGQGTNASIAFAKYMEELAEYIRDDKRGDDQMPTFKVVGCGAISAAYRKLMAALKNNFDITNYNKYPSLNSLAEANVEANKLKKEKEEELALAAEALVADENLHTAVEEAGFEPGTPEHEKEFDRIKNENGMTLIQGGLSEEPDHIDEILALLEVKLRDMERAGYGDQDLDSKVNAVISQWDNYIASAVKAASIAAAS